MTAYYHQYEVYNTFFFSSFSSSYSFFFFFFFFFSFFSYLPSLNLGHTPQRLTIQMPVGQMPVGGATVFWSRTLDRYTRAGLPECVVSTMSGPPPKTTQDRTQTKDTHPIPGQKLKFLIPPGIEPGLSGWKAGTLPTTPRQRMSTIPATFIFHIRQFFTKGK